MTFSLKSMGGTSITLAPHPHPHIPRASRLCHPYHTSHLQVMVNISEQSPSVLLKNMGGATIGVWCAHGEGQALFPNDAVRKHVLDKNLAPIRCVKLPKTLNPKP